MKTDLTNNAFKQEEKFTIKPKGIKLKSDRQREK